MPPQFSTRILDAALERETRDRDAARTELIGRVFKALDELHKSVTFREAWLFGSIVKPYAFNEFSDIDIAVTELDDEHYFKAMSFLSGYLNRDVDLLQMEGNRLSEKIRRTGIPWIRKS